MTGTVAVTGAYGYLGSLIRRRLESAGWRTLALVRRPERGDAAIAWSLDGSLPDDALRAVDALVHCAYDFSPRGRQKIWRTNVEGTRRLIDSAVRAGVGRLLVISSMSAYEGTTQIYGQAKLAIEQMTISAGGVAVRPGLVYGHPAHGMAGTLVNLTRLPLVPVIGAAATQYPVHEEDLGRVIVEILEACGWTPEVVGIAQPDAVSFRALLTWLGAQDGRKCRFVLVPWQMLYAGLRGLEMLRAPVPLRADSLLGLVHPAPFVPTSRAFPGLLDTLRRLDQSHPRRRCRDDRLSSP